MLLSEFIERTGFHPTTEEYRRIEEEYYTFEGDKDAYCRMWRKKHLTGASQRAVAEIENLKKQLEEAKKTATLAFDLRNKENAEVKALKAKNEALANELSDLKGVIMRMKELVRYFNF